MNRLVTTSFAALFAAALFSSTAGAHVNTSDLTPLSNKAQAKTVAATKTISLSAQDLAKMLESQMLAGQAVSMKFKIKGENVNVLADVNSKKVKIESGSMTIISDGQTVWNHQKKSNQVTIDAIGSGRGSALQNPKDIFLFATNYTPKVVIAKNNLYVLTLTPNQKVQSILQAAGGITKLTFTLGVAKDKISIKSATAQSNGESIETAGLVVKSLKKVAASQFAFSQPKGAKIIDLRE